MQRGHADTELADLRRADAVRPEHTVEITGAPRRLGLEHHHVGEAHVSAGTIGAHEIGVDGGARLAEHDRSAPVRGRDLGVQPVDVTMHHSEL